MKKLTSIILVMAFLSPLLLAQTANELTSAEKKDGWKLLFNGKNTDGWRGYNMKQMPPLWKVEDGCLITSGNESGSDMSGDIVTNELYEDFDLSIDWKISVGGNSGIFFHVLEGNYPAPYFTGPEYQLIDDVGFPQKLEEWQQAGANYAMHNADKTKKKLKPAGEFNTSRIQVREGHVIHWLNGEIIVEYDLWTDDWYRLSREGKWKDYPEYGLARKGFIGLQDHGSPVYFRNIKIKDLTEKGSLLFNGKNLDGWKIHGNGLWKADRNILLASSGDDKGYSYLATEKDYRDFTLRLKFMLEDKGNSGVFFRSVLTGTDIKGWQVEVAPPGENTGGIYESGGRGWLAEIPDDKENILSMEDWNDLVIVLKENRVMVWLNHHMMTDLKDDQIAFGNGKIALQMHSGGGVAVAWKDIYLKQISK